MPEAIMTRIHRFADAERSFVTERHGEDEVTSRCMFAFGDGERCRNDWCGRMNRRAFVNVVELEDVRRDAVRERGAGGGRSAACEHRRFIRVTETRNRPLCHSRRRLESAGQRGTKPV